MTCLAIAGEVAPVAALVASEMGRAELNCETKMEVPSIYSRHVSLVPAVRVEALSAASTGARQGESHPNLPEEQNDQIVRTLAAFKISM